MADAPGLVLIRTRDAFYCLLLPDFVEAGGDSEKTRRICSAAATKIAEVYCKNLTTVPSTASKETNAHKAKG